jgi:hypothetical protein
MPKPLFVVYVAPPDEVSDEEYSAFAEGHLAEILETPGFAAARRYRLAPAVPNRPPVEYRFAFVYVMDRPSGEVVDELHAQAPRPRPAWYDRIRYATFDGRPLEEDELELPDHGYMTLSHAPRRFTTDEYHGWYYAHARENLTSEGLREVRRYAVTPVMVDEQAQVKVATATHLAFYTVTTDLRTLRDNLDASARAHRVDVPYWLRECDFTSFDCIAEGPVLTGP